MVNAKEYDFVNAKVKRPVMEKIWMMFKDEEILDGISLSEFLDAIVSDDEAMQLKLEEIRQKKLNQKNSRPEPATL